MMVPSKVGNEHATRSTQWFPIGELLVDPIVQRPLNAAWVDEIAREFDPDKIGVIHVSRRRDDSLVIIDGQHRRAAIEKLWEDPSQKVECKVYENLSRSDEAALFVGLNNFKRPTAIDEYLKNVIAKDPIAVDIDKVVRESGFVVERFKGDNKITAVGTLYLIYAGFTSDKLVSRRAKRVQKDQGKPELLRTVLSIVREAWGGQKDSVNGFVLEGIGRVLAARQRAMSIPDFVQKVSQYPGGANALIGAARGRKAVTGSTVGTAVAEILIDLYNRGRRSANQLASLR